MPSRSVIQIQPSEKCFKYNGLGGHPASDELELGVIWPKDAEKAVPALAAWLRLNRRNSQTPYVKCLLCVECLDILTKTTSCFGFIIFLVAASSFFCHNGQTIKEPYMKHLSKLSAILLFSLSSMSFAETLVYQGKSNLTAESRNDCAILVDVNYQKQIQSIDYAGPIEMWEIIAEKQDGYGPRKEIRYQNSDDLLSQPDLFKNLNFQQTDHIFSEGYTLKSRASIEGPLKSAVDIEFNKSQGKLRSVKITTKFKASIVTLGSKKFECHDLKQVRTRR